MSSLRAAKRSSTRNKRRSVTQTATPQTIALMRKANYTDAEIEEELGVSLQPMEQTLYCEQGKHDWERAKQRGKKPHNCPNHQPAPAVKSTTRTLHCELGDHDWEAPRKQGKGPKNCPDHKPVPIINLDKMREGRHRKSQTDREATIEEIVASPGAQNCHCGIKPSMSDPEMKELCAKSCTSPMFLCPTLDKCMRRVYASYA
jgi:hypothetical protein